MPTPFEEIRFPDAIAYEAVGGPTYSTTISELVSGFEQRNINWSQGRHRYFVEQALKTQAQLDELVAFFHARRGRAIGFRLKDWADYAAVAAPIGLGDGVTAAFQLSKTYASGDASIARDVTKPVDGTVSVYVDSVIQSSGVDVDYTTGVITFDTPPAVDAVIVADFEFDVPVRFNVDTLMTKLDEHGLYSSEKIELVEIRQ